MALAKSLLTLLVAAAACAAVGAHTDEEVAAAMEAAQRSNSRTADPYGDDNLRDAATFMRERVTDAKHNGDKAALFADLDADGDMSISAEEMAKMESHMEDMAKAQPGGLWNVMHNTLKHKSKKGGVHHELMALHDKDGDGAVSNAEFHEL